MSADSPSVTTNDAIPGGYHGSQQGAANCALRDRVHDALGGVAGFTQNVRDELRDWQARSKAATRKADEALSTFEAQFRNAQRVPCTPDDVTAAAALQLEPGFFDRYYGANDVVTAARPEEVRTLDAPVSPQEGSLSVAPVRLNAAAAVQPMLAELRADRTRLARRQSIEMELAKWRDELLPLGDESLLSETLHVNQLELADPLMVTRAQLNAGVQVLAGIEAALKTSADERSAALRSESLAVAEDLTQTILQQYVDILGRVRERVATADAAQADVAEFNAQVDAAKTVHDTAARLLTQIKDLDQKAVADEASLGTWHDAAVADDKKQASAFEATAGEFHRRLDVNATAQEDVWAEIAKQLQRLDGLQAERSEMVEKRLLAVEEERRREAARVQRELRFKSHTGLLDGFRKNLRNAKELVESCDTFNGDSFDGVAAKKWPHRQDETHVDECLRYYDAYRRFVLFSGEVSHRSEQRRTNVRRMLRSVEFQVKTAAETLDADLPAYREQLRVYQTTDQGIGKRLEALKERETDQQEHWRDVEDVLESHDVEFDPPELLLQELQQALLQEHCNAVDELTHTEQKLLDQEKRQAKTMANLCDATKASIADRRQTRAAHKTPSPASSPQK